MRELKWKEVVAEERAMAAARMEVAEGKWRLRLQAKGQEVERFKLDVGELLQTARRLKQQELSGH